MGRKRARSKDLPAPTRRRRLQPISEDMLDDRESVRPDAADAAQPDHAPLHALAAAAACTRASPAEPAGAWLFFPTCSSLMSNSNCSCP
jgi:hypothetical protein